MKVDLGTTTGFVFKAHGVDAPCFVPAAFVVISPHRVATIDQLGYFLQGWSERNLRCCDADTGCRHLFPDESKPLADLTPEEIQRLLTRWRQLSRRS